MNGYYCSNYYGSIGCRNTVTKFGERCKLCVALKSGASLSHGLLSDGDLWVVNEPTRPMAPNRNDSWRSSGGTTSGSTRGTSYIQK